MRLWNIIHLVSNLFFLDFVLKCFHIALGMNDVLPKPFTKEGLLDMLKVSSSIVFRPKNIIL